MLIYYISAACSTPTSGNALIGSQCLPQASASPSNLGKIFIIAFTIIGGIALLFLVIAGLRYIFARGNPETIQKAKNQIQYSLIGLIIAAMAAAIVNYVIGWL